MKYFIKTFGCQMNHSDSERIASFLESRELTPAENITSADLIIYNTCGVRQMAEDRVYGQIHNIRKQETATKEQGTRDKRQATLINNKNKKIIILTGCLANRKDVQKRLKNKVDLFFPINNFDTFENFIIENCLKIENCKLKISAQKSNPLNKETISYLSINPKYTNNYQAYVPIMTGCNNFCAYCVVPYARGREVSRPAKEIIAEIKELVKKGYKEIMLLGQNVNSYLDKSHTELNSECSELSSVKRDLFVDSHAFVDSNRVINFPKLLKMVNAIPGNFWIHFVSSHPKDYSDELIETIAKCKKVCEHIHLPIQAGDNKVLANMNRKYTAKHYLGLIKKIRASFKKYKPEMPYAITSDIIVGFPGETKKQFLESAKIMEKVKYDMVYFGQFSPRPGTAAWKMKDNVSKKEKERRENYLNEILKKTTASNNKKYAGKIVEILVEKEATKDTLEVSPRVTRGETSNKQYTYFGKTRTLKNVKLISSKKNLVGKIVKAKITKANIWNLEACLINKQKKI